MKKAQLVESGEALGSYRRNSRCYDLHGAEDPTEEGFTYEEMVEFLDKRGKLPAPIHLKRMVHHGVFGEKQNNRYPRSFVERYLDQMRGYCFLTSVVNYVAKKSGKKTKGINSHGYQRVSGDIVKPFDEISDSRNTKMGLVIKMKEIEKFIQLLKKSSIRNIDDITKGRSRLEGQFGYWSLHSVLDSLIPDQEIYFEAAKEAETKKDGYFIYRRTRISRQNLIHFSVKYCPDILEEIKKGEKNQTRYKLSYKNKFLLQARILVNYIGLEGLSDVDPELVDDIAENSDLLGDFEGEFLEFIGRKIPIEEVEDKLEYEDSEFNNLEVSKLLDKALDTLPERYRFIIENRHLGEPVMTLENIGKVFGVDRERVRQVEEKAIEFLQHPLRKRILLGKTG